MEEVLYNNIIHYLQNDEFIYSCGTLKKNKILDTKRKRINSKYCCDALKSILREFKSYELETINGENDCHAMEMIRLFSYYLLMNTNINCQIQIDPLQNFERKTERTRKKYIHSPTIVNLIKHPHEKPSFLLLFAEKVKKEKYFLYICPTYRMHSYHKTLLCRYFKYAQALIY